MFLVQSISLGGGSYSCRTDTTEILLLDSQEDGCFFLDREEGLVLKVDCGPILLYISDGEKKKKVILKFSPEQL